MTIIMIVAGFVFCSVSAYLAGLVGSSNNPVSGITICTILFAALVLAALLGRGNAAGPVATIMIGAVVCCAACIAGDNLQDLKAGHIIGASPWRQQVMLGVGAIASAAVMAPVLNLLLTAFGMGPASDAHPRSLQAAQATLMESVARGMFGGALPWAMVIAGVAVGAVIIICDEILKARGCQIPRAGAGGGGWHLPAARPLGSDLLRRPARLAGQTPAACAGGVAREDLERQGQRGMLFAAGLITGESLMGVLIAIPIVVAKRGDVLALPQSLQFGGLARAVDPRSPRLVAVPDGYRSSPFSTNTLRRAIARSHAGAQTDELGVPFGTSPGTPEPSTRSRVPRSARARE